MASPSSTTYSLFVPSRLDKTLLDVSLTVPVSNPNIDSRPTVLITHPYGPLGGNSYNNVVQALRNHFTEKGYIAVTFNFRGCGRSKGRTSWRGQGENEDLNTIVECICSGQWPTIHPATSTTTAAANTTNARQLSRHKSVEDLPTLLPPSHLLICGYSYGGMIAGAVDPQVVGDTPLSLVLISYPYSVTWLLTLCRSSYFTDAFKQWLSRTSPPIPVLVITGNQDQFTSSKSYRRWIESLTKSYSGSNITFQLLDSIDHFWFGHEHQLVESIQEWINNK
ncbi:Alpha/Beta hydrolase protein [Syncephalis plumigaleata]|nr:Alpha/Beta hydrolase protein [Syncephalis plumigaleata]